MTVLEQTRKKTAMLVYAIEVGIANFIKQKLPERSSTLPSLMFGEILQEFGSIKTDGLTKGLSNELKQFADSLDLSTVRNNCCHTVREFDNHYWYRAAAFASDPRLQTLDIIEPLEALACAEQDRINTPPDEWMERYSYRPILNNIPEHEYSFTGLVGRDKEISKITREVLHGRNSTLTLTGYGGAGKTSLAIEVARGISLNAEAKSKFDCIYFTSLKRETLDADGIKKNDSKKRTISEIEDRFLFDIYSLYGYADSLNGVVDEDVKKMISEEKVLLILDNMEELVLENPTAVEDFLQKLPRAWFVLLTSRIPVDGARNEPVPALSEGSLSDLARRYYRKLTGQEISNSFLKNLSRSTHGNPLAVKLIIDRVHLGKSQADASRATIEDIAEFSFKYLLDILENEQRLILEALFVSGDLHREELSHYTKLSEESLSSCLGRLYRTSLLLREDRDDREVYKLPSAIRELMGRATSHLEMRAKIRNDRNANLIASAKINNQGPKDRFSYENSTPPTLITSATNLHKAWTILSFKKDGFLLEQNRDRMVQIEQAEKFLLESELTYGKFADYWKLRSISRRLLEDRIASIELAKIAYEVDTKSILTSYFYADVLISDNANEEASKVLQPTVRQIIEEFDEYKKHYQYSFLYVIFSAYFKTFIFRSLSSDVISMTNDWNDVPREVQGAFCISRCCALRRNNESEKRDSEQRHTQLVEAGKIMKYVISELDLPRHVYERELRKLIDELQFDIPFLNAAHLDNKAQERCEVVSDLLYVSGEDIVPPNLIPQRVENSHDEAKVPSDALLVEVQRGLPGYAFVVSSDGNRYFLPYASLLDSPLLPNGLSNGAQLRAWGIVEALRPGKLPTIQNAYLLTAH